MIISTRLTMPLLRLFIASMLLSLALVGCATPRTRAVTQDTAAGYRLGITVDEDLRVIAIEDASAATNAGVEIGDQVVSLTWVLSEAPDALAGEAITDTQTPLRPPPGVELTSVAFTAPDAIREMVSYGLPLRLQVMRDGEARDLTIVPTPAAEQTAPSTASDHSF